MTGSYPFEHVDISMGEEDIHGLSVRMTRIMSQATMDDLSDEIGVVEDYLSDSGCRLPLEKNAQIKNRLCAYSALKLLLERRSQKSVWRQIRKGLLSNGSDEAWFNVSYTSGMGIAAVADVPVGIDVQKVRSLSDDVLSGICSDGEYEEHFRVGSRGRCQLFSLKESYEKAKNGLGIVWPSTYAEYDKEFNLKRDCGGKAFLSCCLPVANAEYVASVSLLASPLRNIRD